MGRKVVLSHATHLDFDHPYEPDPEEKGFYWDFTGQRFGSSWKTFGYIPDSVYDNVDVRRRDDESGTMRQRWQFVRATRKSLKTLLVGHLYTFGMQGHLWSETVRTPEHAYYMIFPRLLALAERAWHKADWEHILYDKEKREMAKREDWKNFTNILGYQELPYLDSMNITYRISLPGARIINGRVRVISPIPGLPIETSTDKGETWKAWKDDMKFNVGQTIWIALKSADGKRRRRPTSIKIPSNNRSKPGTSDTQGNHSATILATCLIIYFSLKA